MSTDIVFHIIELVLSGLGVYIAARGYFPKSTAAEILLLKAEIEHHKAGLEKLEEKIDKINDYLRGD
jgi:hypothetical protein